MEKIPILSFFTGGGFLDLGLERSGFDVVFTNESNHDFADMFEFGMGSFLGRQVRVTTREDVVSLDLSGIARPSGVFGIVGGPPCPDFSIAGKQEGVGGKHGSLTKRFVEVISFFEPTFFLIENVPALLRTESHRRYFNDEMRPTLEKAGYWVDFKVLNALDFGAPQDRERLFVVGISKGIMRGLPQNCNFDGCCWFDWPIPAFANAKKRFKWPSTSPFGETPEKPERIPEELMVNGLLQRASFLPNSDEYFVPRSSKFSEIPEGDTCRKSCKRLHRYRFSPTVAYGNNEVHFHPWEARRLSVREALMIQTVPDTYVLPKDKPMSKKFKMIGNGVPCVLSSAVGSALRKFIGALCH